MAPPAEPRGCVGDGGSVVAAGGQVVRENGFRNGEAAVILDAAAAAVVAQGVGVGAVVGHDDVVEVQGQRPPR